MGRKEESKNEKKRKKGKRKAKKRKKAEGKMAEKINFCLSCFPVQFSTHTAVPAHFKEQFKGRNNELECEKRGVC